MFCPKCSQQQASEEVRFCSRCGFQLGVVKAILANDAVAAAAPPAQGPLAPVAPTAVARPTRKRDQTFGALLMFGVSLFAAAAADMDEDGVVALIFGWLFLTLLINLRPLLRYFFSRDASSTSESLPAPRRLRGLFRRAAARDDALPPAQGVHVTNYEGQRLNTAEVVRPPSVTEHTTNLLNNK